MEDSQIINFCLTLSPVLSAWTRLQSMLPSIGLSTKNSSKNGFWNLEFSTSNKVYWKSQHSFLDGLGSVLENSSQLKLKLSLTKIHCVFFGFPYWKKRTTWKYTNKQGLSWVKLSPGWGFLRIFSHWVFIGFVIEALFFLTHIGTFSCFYGVLMDSFLVGLR